MTAPLPEVAMPDLLLAVAIHSMNNQAMPETITASFTLKLEGRLLDFAVAVPSRPITLRELLPSLFEFNRQLLDHTIGREQEAGRAISCRAGCGACCRQLVPVGAIEARIVREWVDKRPPDEAERIRARFGEAVARLKAAGIHGRLEDRASLRTPEQTRTLGLDYFRVGVACPFLIDESCSIYEVRPMKCREYLVTSPAASCADPTPDGVRMVGLPGSFLRVLLELELWLTNRDPRWLPLSFLFEADPVEMTVRRPGPELFERFLAEFTAGAVARRTVGDDGATLG